MTNDGIILLDEDRDEMRRKMPPRSSGKNIKGMCNLVEDEQPISPETINQGQDGNYDCETNSE